MVDPPSASSAMTGGLVEIYHQQIQGEKVGIMMHEKMGCQVGGKSWELPKKL